MNLGNSIKTGGHEFANDAILVAVKKDHLTQLIEIQDNNLEIDIFLRSIEPYNLRGNSRLLEFIGFQDSSGKLDGRYYHNNQDITAGKYNSMFAKKLVAYGYRVITDKTSDYIYGQHKPELSIVAKATKFESQTNDTPGFVLTCEVQWQVYESRNDSLLFEWTTSGFANLGLKGSIDDDLYACLEDAVETLLHNEEFKALSCTFPDFPDDQYFRLRAADREDYEDRSQMVQNCLKNSITVVTPNGHGSGFVISEEGYALTSYKVIKDVGICQAVFHNGFRIPARVVATNKASDVALLKINGSGFNAMQMAQSEIDRLGEDVLTIGTPNSLQLNQTVTRGIVSGNREIDGFKILQSDVSVSPGNIGGALINEKGQVIGIVVSKIVDEKVEGIVFAVEIFDALKSINTTLY